MLWSSNIYKRVHTIFKTVKDVTADKYENKLETPVLLYLEG